MKRILTVIAATLLCAASSRAQYVVYDPALHTQTIIDEAENIAKYVMMIDNQVQQISTMTSQLQQLQQYNQAFGTPSQILNLAGFTSLISDLGDTGVGQAVGQLETLAQGINAEQYDANGLYHNVGATFTTPDGSSVSRDANLYRNSPPSTRRPGTSVTYMQTWCRAAIRSGKTLPPPPNNSGRPPPPRRCKSSRAS